MISFQSDLDGSNENHLEKAFDSFQFYEEDNDHQEMDDQCENNNPLSNNIFEENEDFFPRNSFGFNFEPNTELVNQFTENICI